MQIELDPREYRVVGKRKKRKRPFYTQQADDMFADLQKTAREGEGARQPILGPGWPLLIFYFVMFWILFGLSYVPEGSWLSPIARVLSPVHH